MMAAAGWPLCCNYSITPRDIESSLQAGETVTSSLQRSVWGHTQTPPSPQDSETPVSSSAAMKLTRQPLCVSSCLRERLHASSGRGRMLPPSRRRRRSDLWHANTMLLGVRSRAPRDALVLEFIQQHQYASSYWACICCSVWLCESEIRGEAARCALCLLPPVPRWSSGRGGGGGGGGGGGRSESC